MNDFLTCDVRLLVRKVREPNQADHVIGHLVWVKQLAHLRIYFRLTTGWKVISSHLLCLGIYLLKDDASKIKHIKA